jgi:fungalysin metallopeptidase (M36)
MPINFIPNDPSAGSTAPALRVQPKHANRPASRASFTFSNTFNEGKFAPGTQGFLYWQCREAALGALDAYELVAGNLTRWQGNRRTLPIRQDAGVDLNAYYDRSSFSFFHRAIGGTPFFSGASTDVVAHEVGHGLLDKIRPDLWDAPYLETGAFHEAFGDCMAVLTGLADRDTRRKLLAATTTLKKKNFLESTAENLSEGIRRLDPSHNAAEPRHAYNSFQFQIPETLPFDGGPGELINEVHSFGMLFSGCIYDLIAAIFASRTNRTEASLLTSAKTAGSLLIAGATSAIITPRFFQSVGRAMVLADEEQNAGDNRDRIRGAFERHGIMLGANALLAPTAVLEGGAPRLGRTPTVAPATRRDLATRLGVRPGARASLSVTEMLGRRFAHVVHTQDVPLGAIDKRLRGVSMPLAIPVIVGESGGRAAVIGPMPEVISAEREVQSFAASLLQHGQIETATARSVAAVASRGRRAAAQPTHRVTSAGGKKVLVRVRFQCGC